MLTGGNILKKPVVFNKKFMLSFKTGNKADQCIVVISYSRESLLQHRAHRSGGLPEESVIFLSIFDHGPFFNRNAR